MRSRSIWIANFIVLLAGLYPHLGATEPNTDVVAFPADGLLSDSLLMSWSESGQEGHASAPSTSSAGPEMEGASAEGQLCTPGQVRLEARVALEELLANSTADLKGADSQAYWFYWSPWLQSFPDGSESGEAKYRWNSQGTVGTVASYLDGIPLWENDGYLPAGDEDYIDLAESFLTEWKDLIAIDETLTDLTIHDVAADQHGEWLVTFLQVYQGQVPVLQGEVRVKGDASGDVYHLTNNYLPELAVNTTPTIGVERLDDIVMNSGNEDVPDEFFDYYRGPELVISQTKSVPCNGTLLWSFDIRVKGTGEEFRYLVDAHTGELFSWIRLSGHDFDFAVNNFKGNHRWRYFESNCGWDAPPADNLDCNHHSTLETDKSQFVLHNNWVNPGPGIYGCSEHCFKHLGGCNTAVGGFAFQDPPNPATGGNIGTYYPAYRYSDTGNFSAHPERAVFQ